MTKSTDHLAGMVKRVLRLGARADYILMDSLVCVPLYPREVWKAFAGYLYGQGHAQGILLLQGAMAEAQQTLQQGEETSRQGEDPRQCHYGDKEGTEGKNRFCASPPQAFLAGHPVYGYHVG